MLTYFVDTLIQTYISFDNDSTCDQIEQLVIKLNNANLF